MAAAGFTIGAIWLMFHVAARPMDFRVYHYGANGVLDGTRPVYGPASGLGWPMHYRYPPLFILLFFPFALLPLGVAAVVWLLAKIAVLIWLLAAIRKRLPASPKLESEYFLVSALLIAPYLLEEFRY